MGFKKFWTLLIVAFVATVAQPVAGQEESDNCAPVFDVLASALLAAEGNGDDSVVIAAKKAYDNCVWGEKPTQSGVQLSLHTIKDNPAALKEVCLNPQLCVDVIQAIQDAIRGGATVTPSESPYLGTKQYIARWFFTDITDVYWAQDELDDGVYQAFYMGGSTGWYSSGLGALQFVSVRTVGKDAVFLFKTTSSSAYVYVVEDGKVLLQTPLSLIDPEFASDENGVTVKGNWPHTDVWTVKYNPDLRQFEAPQRVTVK